MFELFEFVEFIGLHDIPHRLLEFPILVLVPIHLLPGLLLILPEHISLLIELPNEKPHHLPLTPTMLNTGLLPTTPILFQ